MHFTLSLNANTINLIPSIRENRDFKRATYTVCVWKFHFINNNTRNSSIYERKTITCLLYVFDFAVICEPGGIEFIVHSLIFILLSATETHKIIISLFFLEFSIFNFCFSPTVVVSLLLY